MRANLWLLIVVLSVCGSGLAQDKPSSIDDPRHRLLGAGRERAVWQLQLNAAHRNQGVDSVELVFFKDGAKDKDGYLANLAVRIGNQTTFSAIRYRLESSGKKHVLICKGGVGGKAGVSIPYRFEGGVLVLDNGATTQGGSRSVSLKGRWTIAAEK